MARAAHVSGIVADVVHDLEERRTSEGSAGGCLSAGGISRLDGDLDGRRRARAALLIVGVASGLLALELALGLLAVGRLDALVLAVELLAHR